MTNGQSARAWCRSPARIAHLRLESDHGGVGRIAIDCDCDYPDEDLVQRTEVNAFVVNYKSGLFRKILNPGVNVLSVIKANSYGQGMRRVAPTAMPEAPLLLVEELLFLSPDILF